MGRSDESVVDEAKRVDEEAKRLNFQMKVLGGKQKILYSWIKLFVRKKNDGYMVNYILNRYIWFLKNW